MIPILAMVGTPLHWIAVAAAAIIILAPQYIPVIARILGRLFGMELKRRYGITLKSQPVASKKPAANIPAETRDSQPQQVVSRQSAAQRELQVEEPAIPVTAPANSKHLLPVWVGVLLVLAATTVLLWYLLHAR